MFSHDSMEHPASEWQLFFSSALLPPSVSWAVCPSSKKCLQLCVQGPMCGFAPEMCALLALHTDWTLGHKCLADGCQILSALHLCTSFKKSTIAGSCSLLTQRMLHTCAAHHHFARRSSSDVIPHSVAGLEPVSQKTNGHPETT